MRYPKKTLGAYEENFKLRIELGKHVQEVSKGLQEAVEILETQLERTALAMQYEKEDNLKKAIMLYQKNVDEEGQDPHNYIRLAILYRKLNKTDLEIKTLEKALVIFEGLCFNKNSGFSEQLKKLSDAVQQTQIISDDLNEADSGYYGEQLDFFKKRLDDAHRKNEK
jgi:tetratricopeptide (TPR) repeat protein